MFQHPRSLLYTSPVSMLNQWHRQKVAPFIGTVTSVALMNIHESVREDAQADLARSSISSINMELEQQPF